MTPSTKWILLMKEVVPKDLPTDDQRAKGNGNNAFGYIYMLFENQMALGKEKADSPIYP